MLAIQYLAPMTSPEKNRASEEEPFLLTILPFAGLGVLLVLAVVWRLVPGSAGEESSAEDQPSGPTVVDKWEQAPERDIDIRPERDFIRGPEDALVTLVEFSDFQCPYCRTAANGIHDILREFDGHVRVVFKNFPLDIACNDRMRQPMHPFACEAATLAWCAGQQEEALFWKAHDALFRESQLTAETIERIASELDASLDELNACRGGPEALAAVKEDIALGHSLGVSGTPIFFANGRKVSDYRREALEDIVTHIMSR